MMSHTSHATAQGQRKRRRLLSTLLSISLMGGALLLHASDPLLAQTSAGEVSRLTVEVSNEIYSPFCPGKTLMMCPSPNAAKVRRDIQDLARSGMEKEAIKNQIVATYGEEFRITEPPAKDNALLVTIILIALAIAILAVILLSRRKKLRQGDVAQGQSHIAPFESEAGEARGDDLSDEERAYLSELRAHIED